LKNSGLGVFYVKGGIFMHPLLLCSIAGLVIIIERLWTLSRARVNVKALMMKIILALREQGPQASSRYVSERAVRSPPFCTRVY